MAQVDPYSAYGGSTATSAPNPAPAPAPAPANDPYAAYGGATASDPTSLANQALAGTGITVGAPPKPAPPPALAKPAGPRENLLRTALHSDVYNAIDDLGYAIGEIPQHMRSGFLKEAASGAIGADNLVRAGMRKVGLNAPPVDETDFGLEKGSTDTHGFAEDAGGFAENTAEFIAMEGMAGAVGKTAKLEKYTDAAKMLTKWKPAATVIEASMGAVKQGMIAGAQTYARTGGDRQKAFEASVYTAGLGLLMHAGASGMAEWIRNHSAIEEMIGDRKVTIPAEMRDDLTKPTDLQAQGQAEYRTTAQESARGPLEDINKSREPNPNQGGTAAGAAQDTEYIRQAKAELGENANIRDVLKRAQELKDAAPKVKPPVKIDVDKALNTVHDFTGAADLVEQHAQDIYGRANDATGGKFKSLNEEWKRLEKEAWDARGTDKAADLKGQAIEKENELGDLIDKLGTKNGLSKAEVDAARGAFNQTRILRKVGRALDSAWSDLPGRSTDPKGYRGFDGNRLMTGLKQLVNDPKIGRAKLETAIGKQRLASLERIAELNRTPAQRARFGAAIQEVSKYLKPEITTTAVGGIAARAAGIPFEYGMAAGYFGGKMGLKVVNAVLSNPKIAENLAFAMESGARPKFYGPLIGTMIQQSMRDDKPESKEDEGQ